MTVYNVQATVVSEVEADSPQVAYDRLAESLRAAGFEPFDAVRDDDIASVFESDEQTTPQPLPGGRP